MASPLVLKSSPAPDPAGVVLDLTPARAGWTYVSFRVWRLAENQRVHDRATGEELGLVVLSGRVDIKSNAGEWLEFGGRTGVFAGKPHALYLPPGTEFELTARGPCEVARCGAKAERGVAAYAITPEAIKEEVRGEGAAQRHIRHLLEVDRPAEHLLLVEVITPAGHWSSYPPHKHDTDDPPHESRLEETYYHRLQPERGFG
ncbi:MAG TPA: 5-deoxy-glucuronate isomerase, partial [Limnochordia bacterium]|nr:5-deoxy-glucuronate isomerase [Limnochordia bacterium]